METFRYRAMDASGRSLVGVAQADTARQARAQLRTRGLLPVEVAPVTTRTRGNAPWVRGMTATELSLVTRQFGILLDSGLTMEQTLDALIDEAAETTTREVLTGVKSAVSAGQSLASSLGGYPGSFPDFYQALVNGGEESGALPTVLLHLADYLDTRQALKQKTTLALLYPILVTLVAIAIVAGLLVYVVPQVVQVFQQSRQALPLLTRGLIALSDLLRSGGLYLVVFAIAGSASISLALRHDATQRRWHSLLLRMPGVGPLIRGINTSRFASTLAILVGGGVPLLAGLASSARGMTNLALRAAVERAIERVREGASLARALGETGAFPPLLIHLVASGEVSGTLERMLQRAAKLETQSLERRLAVFLTLLEPVMILVMGGVVLLIVLAVLLPIIEINQLVR